MRNLEKIHHIVEMPRDKKKPTPARSRKQEGDKRVREIEERAKKKTTKKAKIAKKSKTAKTSSTSSMTLTFKTPHRKGSARLCVKAPGAPLRRSVPLKMSEQRNGKPLKLSFLL